MSNAGFWKIDVKKHVFMAMAQRKTIVDGEKKKSTKKFGSKNLNSTHFKTFVKKSCTSDKYNILGLLDV